MKRHITSIAAVLLIGSLLTSCGADTESSVNSPQEAVSTVSTEISTVNETVTSSLDEPEQTVSETTAENDAEKIKVASDVTSMQDAEKEAIITAVRKGIKSFNDVNVDDMMKYVDMDVAFYEAYKRVPSEEELERLKPELKETYENSQNLFANTEKGGYEISSILPLSECEDIRKYLYEIDDATMPFVEAEEKLNITDVYVVRVKTLEENETVESTSSATDEDGVPKGYIDEANGHKAKNEADLFVFKINGDYKIDIIYSFEYFYYQNVQDALSELGTEDSDSEKISMQIAPD
jgi:hypothetical protein